MTDAFYTAREVTRLLSQAVETADVNVLREAFKLLIELKETGPAQDPYSEAVLAAPNDLYLYTAEAALAVGEWEIATTCVNRMVECNTASSKANYIRTLYCRAAVEHHASEGLRGRALQASVAAALGHVMRGIKMGLTDPSQLAYLVAHGASQAWNVAWRLYKEGSYTSIANALGYVVQALERIDLQDYKTRISWLMRHGTALAGCGRSQEASAAMQKAADLCAKPNVPSGMKIAIFRAQVAMAKAVPNPKLKADASKGTLRGVLAAHSVLCGAAEGPAAEAELTLAANEIQADLKANAVLSAADTGAEGKKAAAAAAAANAKGGKGGDAATAAATSPTVIEDTREDVLAEIALAFAVLDNVEKAMDIANKLAHSKRLRAHILSDFASALATAKSRGGLAVQAESCFNCASKELLQDLLTALHRIERALESALRIPDQLDRSYVVQLGAVLMWNIALPLLQPTTRGAVAKPLASAVKALEEVGSNMGALLVKLHFEVGLVDADSDYMSKALSRLDRALTCDYVADVDDVRLYGMNHPMDRYALWEQRRLQLRGNVYHKADNAEDEALALLEQARDADAIGRISILLRVKGLLAASEPPLEVTSVDAAAATADKGKAPAPKKAPTAAAPSAKQQQPADADDGATERVDPVAERKRELLRVRTRLWHTVMTLAWVAPSDIDLARFAADRIAERQWTRRGDRDMRIMQATAHARLAESYVLELERRGGLFLGQRSFMRRQSTSSEADDDGADEAKEDAEQVAAIGARIAAVGTAVKPVHTNLIKMAAIGAELCGANWEDSWIVLNAATMAWNFHMRAMQTNDYLTGLPAFEAVFNALLQVNASPKKECALLRDVGAAYVRGLQQSFLRDRGNLTDSVDDMERLSRMEFNKAAPGAAEASAHPKLAKALEVCEKMIQLLPAPMETLDFVAATVAIRYWQAKPVDVRVIPQLKVLSAIQQLTFVTGADERRNIANAAVDALALDPNVELCAKLAEPSIQIQGFERMTLRICAIGQALYNEGLLGQRQADTTAQAAAPKAGKAASDPKSKAAQAAAAADTTSPPPAAVPPPASDTDWLWYALLLQYQGVATTGLINPSLQSKTTQIGIRKQALSAFTNSAIASLRAPPELRGKLVLKAIRLYAAHLDDASTAAVRLGLLPSLRRLLSDKVLAQVSPKGPQVDGAPSDFDALGALFIVLARGLRDARKTEEGLTVMRSALKVLPASHHRPFWDLDVELRCAANMPLNATLLRVKEYSPQMQARVWLAVARCSPSIDDQRFAYCNAARALQSNHAADHGMCTLSFAQWMLKVNDRGVSLSDLRAFILSAIDGVADRIEASSGAVFNDAASVRTLGGASEFDDFDASRANSRSSIIPPAGTGPRGSDATQLRSNASSRATGGAATTIASTTRKQANEVKVNVPSFLVAIQGYAMLASIAGSQAVAVDEVPADRRSTALMAAHYVLRLWELLSSSANANILKARSRQARTEARAAQIAAAAQATAAAASAGPTGGATAAAANAKKKQSRVVLPEPGVPGAAAGGRPAGGAAFEPTTTVPAELIQLPRSFEGWLGFKPPASLVAQLLTMSKSMQSVNATTVEDPDIAIATLWHLAETLLAADLPLQAVPALQLASLFAEVLMPQGLVLNALKAAAASQCFTIAQTLGADGLCAAYRVANVHPTVPEKAVLHEDTTMAAATQREASQVALSQGTRDPRLDLAPASRVRSVYNNWIHVARALITEGRFSGARDLLREASEHAEQLSDSRAIATIGLLNARLLTLEGRYAVATHEISKALAVDEALPTAVLSEGHILLATVLVRQGACEDALQAAHSLLAVLESKLAQSHGLETEVARSTLPDAAIAAASEIAHMVLTHVETQLKIVSSGIDASRLLELTRALLMAARRFDGVATELSALEARVERLTLALIPSQNFKLLTQVLSREAHLLQRVVEELRNTVDGADVSASLFDARSVSWRLPAQVRLSRALSQLAMNVSDRVALRHRLFAAYRASNVTEVAFPHVTGADAKLEGKVVDFMRSTRKERKAALRRERIASQRQRVEEQRATARAEKQREVERRREARRLEEAAGGKGAKDAKAKPGAKGAPQVDPDPDVDPHDKCGIVSPGGSEDDGSGEDTHDEEARELQHAIASTTGIAFASGNNGDHPIAHAGIDGGFVAASAAQELSDDWGLEENAAAIRRWFAYGNVGWETRRALLEASPYPPVDESVMQRDKWHRPIDVAGLEEKEVDGPGAAGKGAATGGAGAGKKPEPKAAGKKDAAGAAAAAPPPVVTAKSATPGLRLPQNRRPPHMLQAIAAGERALITAHQTGDVWGVAESAFELIDLFAFSSETIPAAGHCIALAVAARNAAFVTDTWSFLCHPEQGDAVIHRAILSMRDAGTHITPQGANTAKVLYQNCRLLSRVRLPDVAIGHFPPASGDPTPISPVTAPGAMPANVVPPAAAAAAAVGGATGGVVAPPPGSVAPVQLPPGDVASLSVAFHEATGFIYAVLHRPGAASCDIRRAPMDLSRISQVEALSDEFAEAKRQVIVRAAAANRDASEADIAQVEAMCATHLVRPAKELLQGILRDFEHIFDVAGPRWHLVLNVDARLQFLPWEAIPAFARMKSVSRDLSVFATLHRLQRRAADRYSSATGVTFIVDVHKEHPTAAAALFAPDDQPRNSQWSLHVSGDEENKKHPFALSLAQVQRALTHNNPATVVFDVCGALSNTVPPQQWLGLDLGHVRLAVVLDHATNAASSRRENKANVVKTPKRLKLEQSGWAMSMLMLARGCECVVGHNSQRALTPKTTDMIGKCLVTALEKQGGPRHFGEIIRGHLFRGTLPEGKRALPAPAEGDAFGLWALPFSDRFSFSVFGLSPDDTIAAPVDKTAKK